MLPPSLRFCRCAVVYLKESHDQENSRPGNGEHDGSNDSEEVDLSASVGAPPAINQSQCCPDHAKDVDDADPEKSQNRVRELILSAHGQSRSIWCAHVECDETW